jgi:hypothetical protein
LNFYQGCWIYIYVWEIIWLFYKLWFASFFFILRLGCSHWILDMNWIWLYWLSFVNFNLIILVLILAIYWQWIAYLRYWVKYQKLKFNISSWNHQPWQCSLEIIHTFVTSFKNSTKHNKFILISMMTTLGIKLI